MALDVTLQWLLKAKSKETLLSSSLFPSVFCCHQLLSLALSCCFTPDLCVTCCLTFAPFHAPSHINRRVVLPETEVQGHQRGAGPRPQRHDLHVTPSLLHPFAPQHPSSCHALLLPAPLVSRLTVMLRCSIIILLLNGTVRCLVFLQLGGFLLRLLQSGFHTDVFALLVCEHAASRHLHVWAEFALAACRCSWRLVHPCS